MPELIHTETQARFLASVVIDGLRWRKALDLPTSPSERDAILDVLEAAQYPGIVVRPRVAELSGHDILVDVAMVTVDEAASILGVSERTIRRHIRTGRLTAELDVDGRYQIRLPGELA